MVGGGLGGQRLACVLFRLCPRLHHCFLSFWAMEGQHGRPDTTDLHKACRCNGRSKGRPCPCPSVSWDSGDGHTFQKEHIGVATSSLRDMLRRRERDINPTTQSLDLPLPGHLRSHRRHARFAGLGNARRMPWMRGCAGPKAPKKGRPGTPRVSGGKQGGSRPGKLSRRVAAAGFRPRCRRSAPMPAPLPQVGGACSP